MMRFLPHTDADIAAMLAEVGASSLEDLFASIPADCRTPKSLDLPGPLSEWDLNARMDSLEKDMPAKEVKCFVGAGSYEHYIPAAIPYLLSRSEFSTAYTPYQPEISQGTLQAIYEYQTLTSRLLGLDVANASLYDGATALAEALLMAIRVTRRKTVAISQLVHPLYRRVVRTYFHPTDYQLVELPQLPDGRTDFSGIGQLEDLAAVAVQSPNFLGCIEDLENAGQMVHAQQGLFIVGFSEALAFGLYHSPGAMGADIACGEGQSLGIAGSFGGPALGMLACRSKFMRSMPGRLVGATRDKDGRRGFVLTLATREQHIRREKATSNICTNNSLCAVTAAMYMALLGRTGVRELARLNYDKCEYLKQALVVAGVRLPYGAPTFNEFVAEFPPDFADTHASLMDRGIFAGLDLSVYDPGRKGQYLFCVTETKTRDDLDFLLKEVSP